MTFDDFQYQNVNQYVLDMKLKPKRKKDDKSLYDSSLDGSITDSDEDEADLKLNKNSN